MSARLQMLLAQQTTPDEVVIFLLLTILAALAVAFLIYGVLLAGFWHWRLREVASIRALLFPRFGQLRTYAPEYALAAMTAMLLSLTIVERNEVVQLIHGYEIERLPDPASEAIRTAMPFRSIDAADIRLDDDAQDPVTAAVVAVLTGAVAPTLAIAEVGAAALLRPMLAAGEGGRGMAALRAIAGEVAPSAWTRVVSRNSLLAAAALLLLLYSAWLAWTRGRAVEADPDANVDYRRLAGRLVVPALCVALLLSSAVRAGDPDRYARSALATAGLVELSGAGAAVEREVLAAMARQSASVAKLRYLVAGSEEIPSLADIAGRIDSSARGLAAVDVALQALDARVIGERAAADSVHMTLERRISAAEARAAGARETADAAGRRAAAVEEQMAAVREALGRMESELRREAEARTGLATTLDQLDSRVSRLAETIGTLRTEIGPTTGIIFVAAQQGDDYQIQPGRRDVQPVSGQWTGAHALLPGTYVVTARGTRRPVRLRAGDVVTVRFPAPIIR
jgi:hypothetical protein